MKRQAVFLDRDGTIIEDPGYVDDPAKVKLLPGAASAIRGFAEAGFLVVIVSNQSGVARGLFDEGTMSAVHARLEELLEAEEANLDGAYYCPFLDGPDAVVEAYRRDSELRKPKPGLLLQAANELDIDLRRSWMIGDSPRDAEAGQRAGCRTILIDPDRKHAGDRTLHATLPAADLNGALELVVSHKKRKASAVESEGVSERDDLEDPSSLALRESARAKARGSGRGSARAEVRGSGRESARAEARGSGVAPNHAPSNCEGPTPDSEALESDGSEDIASQLGDIREQLARDLPRIQDQLDRAFRRGRQDDFSLLRLFGALLQMFAIVAAIWGAAALTGDQSTQATPRLLLACFLQLAAISAFAIDRFR